MMGTRENIGKVMHGMKPFIVMVIVQVIYAGVNMSYKIACFAGMDPSIVTFYRISLAAVLIVPVAFLAERNKRPKLTWATVFQAFCGGLVGTTLGQNLNGKSIVYASATYATAISNLTPATTFILAVALRVERFGWNTSGGKGKVVGTIVGISGAMLFTFYKGPELHLWNTNINLLHSFLYNRAESKPLLGAFLALIGCFSMSLWLIIQRKATVEYPCPLSFTALTMAMSSIHSFVYAICVDRDWNQWKLGWDTKLITVAYMGIFGSAVLYYLMTWCVSVKGAVYVSSFNPLTLIVVAVVGSLCLNEKLHLGIVFGGIVIIIGLYIVLRGKREEMKGNKKPAVDKNHNRMSNVVEKLEEGLQAE